MEEMEDERDPALETETENQMMVTEQIPEIETGEKEASTDPPDQDHAMILDKEDTDPLLKEEPKEILLVEATVEGILVEGMEGIRLETAVTDHTLETGIEINPNTTTEGQHIILETVTIVGKGRGMTEMDVVKELFPRKDKEIAEEVRVEEEEEKLKKVKVVMVS